MGFVITTEELQTITNLANDVEGNVPEGFECLFCAQLVFDAKMCKECDNTLFCEPCIREWRSVGNSKCP